jgi:protein-S-isoprenylcysteine O-methyltransferase Ste14
MERCSYNTSSMSTAPALSPFARGLTVAGGLLFVIALGWGVAAYLTTLGEDPPPWSLSLALPAILVDTLLFTLFAAHHSVFARATMKRRVAALVSDRLERTLYVVVASVLFVALLWGWRTVPGVAWRAAGATAAGLTALQVAGLVLTALASRRLGVLELAGLRPVRRPSPGAAITLERTGLYGLVRHPIYFGWALMVWPAPVMTGSRLLFAILSTLYLVVAIPLEERTLVEDFGDAYRDYQRDVRWRMVPGVY